MADVTLVKSSGSSSTTTRTIAELTTTDTVPLTNLHPVLETLGGLTTAADKLPYFTNTDVAGTCDLTSFARTLIDDASSSAARATLGLVIGTDVAAEGHNHDATYQPLDADLTAIAALGTVGLVERTGAGTADIVTVTAAAKTILDDASTSAMRSTLGLVIGSDVAAQAHVGSGGAAHAVLVGDSGSGGTAGFAPAPAAGDGAAGAYLSAYGTWTVPPGAGGGITLPVAVGLALVFG